MMFRIRAAAAAAAAVILLFVLLAAYACVFECVHIVWSDTDANCTVNLSQCIGNKQEIEKQQNVKTTKFISRSGVV